VAPGSGGQQVGELLARGRAALARGDWAAARSLFRDALGREDSPEACHGLAGATEWAGDFAAAVELYERAYRGYRARGESRRPALIAGRELAFLHAAVYGDGAVAGGWLARARRLADEAGDCPERGWVELAAAMATGEPDEIEKHALEATSVAARHGEEDLRFCALGYQGLSQVLRGRVADGMRMLDEATLAASCGEVRDHQVAGEIYCKMLLCCELALDVGRAQQWITVADRAGRAANDLWVSGICRMHYGGILTAAGRWPEAETELTESLRLHDTGMRALRTGAVVRLADVRFRQGRLGEAGELLDGNEFDQHAVLPLARLHLARGEPELAATVLRRSLDTASATVLQAPALALYAELRPPDSWPVERLRGLAEATGLPHVRALVDLVAAGAAGEPAAALARLESALRHFTAAGLPWEAARTRLRIARLLATTAPEVARAEARSAVAALARLGAARDIDEAGQVLRLLGARPVPPPRSRTGLTTREREVYALIAEGLSNGQIAERLFLSKRTVEHHVGSILAKVGATTRAEALARFARHGPP
jgi:DNA-binding NarL/FixJ family response regulator